MIEKELHFITDFTLNKVKQLGSFFTYRKLLNTDIHPAVLKYISANIDFKIYEDRKKLLQQSNFDYSGFEIAKYFDLISQQIQKKTKITYDDIKNLIVEAVTFNADYTVRPNSTLKRFIFSEKNKLSTDEIKMKLDSLYYYSYFSDVLNAYFKKAKTLALTSKDFEKIIQKLDQSTFIDKKEELVEYALNSIADYYNVGSTDKSKIPVNLVGTFLEDKKLNDYLERLNHGFSRQSKQLHEISDITKILFSTEPIKQPAAKATPKIEKDEIIEFEEDIPQKPIHEEKEFSALNKKNSFEKMKSEPDLKDADHENLDPLYNFDEDKEFIEDESEAETKELIDKEIEKSNEFELSSEEDAPTAEDQIKNEEAEKKINFPEKIVNEEIELLQDFVSSKKEKKTKIFEPSDKPEEKLSQAEEKPAPQKISRLRKKDLFYYLSNREIEKIVASIFNDDREDFATTMEKISESKNYDEATEILKDIFSAYNINPYSRDAITLTNCVSNYFEQN